MATPTLRRKTSHLVCNSNEARNHIGFVVCGTIARLALFTLRDHKDHAGRVPRMQYPTMRWTVCGPSVQTTKDSMCINSPSILLIFPHLPTTHHPSIQRTHPIPAHLNQLKPVTTKPCLPRCPSPTNLPPQNQSPSSLPAAEPWLLLRNAERVFIVTSMLRTVNGTIRIRRTMVGSSGEKSEARINRNVEWFGKSCGWSHTN